MGWQETKIDDPQHDQIPYKEEGFGFDLPGCIEHTMIHIQPFPIYHHLDSTSTTTLVKPFEGQIRLKFEAQVKRKWLNKRLKALCGFGKGGAI
jgi:hypothetical protein